MGFWVFMLVMSLVVPAIMAIFGFRFTKHAPKEINSVFGYRTAMSMKNRDTWDFAHKYCGRIWYISGLIMLAATAAISILTFGKSDNYIGAVGAFIETAQIIVLIAAVPFTESALKKTFDQYGNRR